MELKEQFNAQWNGIRDVVLSEAKRQLKFHGTVDGDRLTARLREETGKWNRGVLAQGLWFEEFKTANPEGAANFSVRTIIHCILEPADNRPPKHWWISLIFAAMALLLGYVLHAGTNLSLLEQCFYPALSFVVLQTLYLPLKAKRIQEYEQRILADIDDQLQDMKRELETYIQ